MKQTILKYSVYCSGILILALGLSLTVKAALGTGAWPALNVGLSMSVGMTVGSWTVIVGLILIMINSFLLKTFVGLFSLVPMIILGFFMDFWLLFALNSFTINTFVMQWAFLLIGIVLTAIGITTYLQVNLPLIPIDDFMRSLQIRFNLSMGMAKTIAEIVAIIFAILFSGPIGLGTILVTIVIGPLTQYLFPKSAYLVKGILKLFNSCTVDPS